MKILKNKGISLLEVIIAFGVIGILAAIIVPNLSQFHKQQVLQDTSENIISLLNEARNNTISSKNSSSYGVRFQADKAILFAGLSYSDSPTNKQINLDSSVTIPGSGGINLNGGGSDVIFDRITGDTAEYGTIVIRLASDASKQKTVTISKIGVITSN
jgi:type II secretory pathway pseudopilin PulG